MSSSEKRICLDPADIQETTIEKLCDDVSEEIFSYLSAEDLKSASLVCKHWNEVIGSSAGTMKKLKLKLKEGELMGRQFRSSRNYQNIELEMLTTNPPSDQKALENLDHLYELSDVKYFKIFAFNQDADPENTFRSFIVIKHPGTTFLIDAMKLKPALKQMKQLQELFIECPGGLRGSFTSTIDLKKLTKLAVKCPDLSIFQWLSASNVTEIDVSHQSYAFPPTDVSDVTANVQYLASFLKLGKQIKTLKLNSSIFDDLFGNGKWKDLNLKLSGLEIEGNRKPDATSLREFLMSLAPSLTSLRMKNVSFRSEEDSVIEAMGRLKNLKILSLFWGFRSDETYLRHLPELEQLTLYNVNDINSIARFNRKLTYLKIELVKNPLDAGLELSELKHLCIGIDSSSNCLKLIKSSPKVETIELRLPIRSFDVNIFDEAVKAALQQPNLRHLKLDYRNNYLNIEHIEKAFVTIAGDYGNLKSLSVRANVGPEKRSVEFFFTENRLDWNVDEQKKRLLETFADK